MATSHPSLEQADSLRPLKNQLPTMYDLPSENPGSPVLPDEFQPQLLSAKPGKSRSDPHMAVELLSLGTAGDDLGQTQRSNPAELSTK
jgi:hypothetical protein